MPLGRDEKALVYRGRELGLKLDRGNAYYAMLR